VGRALRAVQRTKLYGATQNWKRLKYPGKRPSLIQFAEPREVCLAPILGLDEGLTKAEDQAKWRWLVEEAVKHYPPTRPVLGAEKILVAPRRSQPHPSGRWRRGFTSRTRHAPQPPLSVGFTTTP
jgi:hypothetical protein